MVRLRVPTRDDLPFIRALWADGPTMAAVGGPVVLREEQAEAWFCRMVDPGAPTDRYFLIDHVGRRPVGEISLHRYDVTRRAGSLNVKILHAERGRGFGAQALRTFLDWYFGEFGGEVLTDDLAPANAPARCFRAAFGFVRDHSGPEVFRMRLDRAYFAIPRPDQP